MARTWQVEVIAADLYDGLLQAQEAARFHSARVTGYDEPPVNVPPSAGQQITRTFTFTLEAPDIPEGNPE